MKQSKIIIPSVKIEAYSSDYYNGFIFHLDINGNTEYFYNPDDLKKRLYAIIDNSIQEVTHDN